jgi:hypothetical protein
VVATCPLLQVMRRCQSVVWCCCVVIVFWNGCCAKVGLKVDMQLLLICSMTLLDCGVVFSFGGIVVLFYGIMLLRCGPVFCRGCCGMGGWLGLALLMRCNIML